MYETLAEVLSERLTTREARPEDVRLANELRAELDRAATEMIAAIAPPPGAPALRLTKGIVSALVACERFASETLGLPDETATMNIAIGNLLGSLVTFHVLGETPADMVTPESTLQHGMDLVRAGQPTDPILELVESLAPEKRKALAGELSGRYSALISGWPRFDPDWWPRVEETARVRLADDAVLLSGRFDVLVGGPPSRYPLIVVEVTSGRWQDDFGDDQRLYALLATIRDRVRPAVVATCCVEPDGDGGHMGRIHAEDVTDELLADAVARVARAMKTAARLITGEAPTETFGATCWYCPARDDCRTFEKGR